MRRKSRNLLSTLIGVALLTAAAPMDISGQVAAGPPDWLVTAVDVAVTVNGVRSAEGLQKVTAYYMTVRAQLDCTQWDALWAQIPISPAGARIGCWLVSAPQDDIVPKRARSLVTFSVDFEPGGMKPIPEWVREITEIARNLDPMHRVLNSEMWAGNGTNDQSNGRLLAIWRDSPEPCPPNALRQALQDAVEAAEIDARIDHNDCRKSIVGPVYSDGMRVPGPTYVFMRQAIKP